MTNSSFQYPKGRVMVQGYFFDQSMPESVLQNRVLSLWGNGSALYKIESGLVLLQNKAKPEFIEHCLGAPLIRQGNVLSNVWLSTIGNSDAPGIETLHLFFNGELSVVELDKQHAFDPSVWLVLDGYCEAQMDSLGDVRQPDTAVDKQEVSVREALGDAELAESNDLKNTLDRLEKMSKNAATSSGGSAGVGSLFSRLIRAFRSGSRRSPGSAQSGQSRPNYSTHPNMLPRNGLLQRIANAFSDYLMNSALAKAIGKVHAKHVQKMMDQFSDGNLEDALKNAIPLSNLQDALQAKHASLGLSGKSLHQSIRPYSSSSGSSVILEDNLLYQLRQMYEKAFKELDQQGNHKKAAFVLAELLRDIDRAVQYLEKHQQYTLAAELAEGQKLSPARIVRQWILAKEVERAMEVAVIAGCYQEAITLLQNTHPEKADDLRWHCAQLHYDAGDINAAVEIAWPIKAKRKEVVEWMKQSFHLGGDVGARHLLRLALFDGDNYQQYMIAIDQHFKNQDANIELALLDEIVKYGNKAASKRIASIAARYYLSAIAKGRLGFDRKRWNQLCQIAGDLTLRADVRGLDFNHVTEAKPDESKLVTLTFGPSHGREAVDCVSLSDGSTLVAFGEAGVELWSAKGQLTSRFSVPCHHIIVADNGNKALLLASRSGYQLVHKFDFRDRSVTHWLEADIHYWASSFDGHTWIVSHQDQVFVLDVLASEQSTLWSIKDLPGVATSIVRTPDSFSICLSDDGLFQVWVYQLPNLYLQERTPFSEHQLKRLNPAAINERGDIIDIYPEELTAFGLYDEKASTKWVSLGADNKIQQLIFLQGHTFIATSDSEMAYVDVFPVANQKVGLSSMALQFFAAQSFTIRALGDNLLLSTNTGRVVSINLVHQRIDVDFTLN